MGGAAWKITGMFCAILLKHKEIIMTTLSPKDDDFSRHARRKRLRSILTAQELYTLLAHLDIISVRH